MRGIEFQGWIKDPCPPEGKEGEKRLPVVRITMNSHEDPAVFRQNREALERLNDAIMSGRSFWWDLAAEAAPAGSPRERDCGPLQEPGFSDGEISDILLL